MAASSWPTPWAARSPRPRTTPPGSTARPRPTTTPPASSSRACRSEGISWMSHGDYMAKVPEGFALTAHSDACPNVAIADETRGFYGVQYHPEVNHTEHGMDMIRNFLYEVCGAKGDWTMGDYCETAIAADPGEGGRRQGAAGPVRRRGLLRGRRPAGRGGGQSAHLRVCGPRPHAARTRATRWRPPSPSGTSTSSAWTRRPASCSSWPGSSSRSASGRSSARSSSGSLRRRPRRSARWTTWSRAPSTPT